VWDRWQSLEASNENYRVYQYRFFCHTGKSFGPMVKENLNLAFFSFQTFFIHIPFPTSMLKADFI